MIEHEFLFLGLLADRPKHGYEIKRQIEEDLAPNIGLRIKSIYYPLMKMEKEGLIIQETHRQGRFPEKYVYQITPKGLKKFNRLIQESFSAIERPFFQIDLSLYFLHLAPKETAKRRLKKRVGMLHRIAKDVTHIRDRAQSAYSQSAYLIHQHNLDLIQAEIASTLKLIEKI